MIMTKMLKYVNYLQVQNIMPLEFPGNSTDTELSTIHHVCFSFNEKAQAIGTQTSDSTHHSQN